MRERRRDLLVLSARRAVASVIVVPAVVFGVFALAAASPLDPLVAYMGDGFEHATSADREAARTSLGLDRTWWQSASQWWVNAMHGDLGYSHALKQPVTEVFAERLPWTILLAGCGLVIALAVALGCAMLVAYRPRSRAARLLERLVIVTAAVPSFVLGLFAVSLFAVTLGWFPVGGAAEPGRDITLGSLATHVVLPAFVFAAGQAPWMVLVLTAGVREALAGGPVREARARGLAERTIVWRHVLPVSGHALLALAGTRLPDLVVGALVVEEIFAWPGLAEATVDAALTADVALLAAVTFATSVAMVAGTWLADSALLVLDPRVAGERR